MVKKIPINMQGKFNFLLFLIVVCVTIGSSSAAEASDESPVAEVWGTCDGQAPVENPVTPEPTEIWGTANGQPPIEPVLENPVTEIWGTADGQAPVENPVTPEPTEIWGTANGQPPIKQPVVAKDANNKDKIKKSLKNFIFKDNIQKLQLAPNKIVKFYLVHKF